jgi:hypothetical protein
MILSLIVLVGALAIGDAADAARVVTSAFLEVFADNGHDPAEQQSSSATTDGAVDFSVIPTFSDPAFPGVFDQAQATPIR